MTNGEEEIMELGNRMNQISLCGKFALEEDMDLL
jgi:hypothetical protein